MILPRLLIWAGLSITACSDPQANGPRPHPAEPQGGPASQGSAESARCRALLIGINVYAAKNVPPLEGCLNDVVEMKRLLEQRYGFPPGQITVLTDAQATRERIMQALQRLIQDAKKGDWVCIHYAGHGSQATDTDGDEADGLDETLVPHDGRTEGVADITDDELRDRLDQLAAKVDIVRVVLDSCHSGTGTRKTGLMPRHIPPDDKRPELYVAVRKRLTSSHRGGADDAAKMKHVLLAGAASNQTALDGRIPDEGGRAHGAFTYALLRSIGRSGADRSLRTLIGDVGEEFHRLANIWQLNAMPSPQLEGPPGELDAPLFPAHPVAERAWVEYAAADGKLSLRDPGALGVVEGAVWALYGPAETRFLPKECAGLAVVRRSGPVARLEPVKDSPRDPPAAGRAVVVLQRPGETLIRLDASPADRERAEGLFKKLQEQIPKVTRVLDPDGFAQLHLHVAGDRCEARGADDTSVIATVTGAQDEVVRTIVLAVNRLAGSNQLMMIEPGDAPIRLDIEATRAPVPEGRGFEVVADQSIPVYHPRAKGDPRKVENSLQLAITADRPCYLTIVDINEQGRVVVLFPFGSQKAGFYPDGAIPGGQKVMIPDSLEAGNRAGFYWDCTPPLGRDVIRVFATLDAAAAKELRETLASPKGAVEGVLTGGAGGAQEASTSKLVERLNPMSRGFTPVAGELHWKARSLVIRTEARSEGR